MTTGQHQPATMAAPPRAPRLGDWVIAALAVLFFAGAYFVADTWPSRAAMFPHIVSAAGLVLSILKIVGLGFQAVRGRAVVKDAAIVPSTTAALLAELPQDSSPEAKQLRTAAAEGERRGITEPADGTAVTLVDDEAEEDESMEYVFATAGARAWMEALAWIVVFFVTFFVLGAYVSVPVFALFYLKFSGGATWRSAAIYAVVAGAIIYGVFHELVFIPLPTGYIPFLQGL